MRLTALLLTLLLFAPIASAQESNPSTASDRLVPFVPGMRIRIHAPSVADQPLVGTVVSWDADKLIINTAVTTRPEALKPMLQDRAIPWDGVSRLEVSQGRVSRTGRGMLIGLFVGAAGGAQLGYATACESPSCLFSKEDQAFIVGLLGALGGFIVGHIIGNKLSTEEWEEKPLEQFQLGLVPNRYGKLMLSMSIGF